MTVHSTILKDPRWLDNRILSSARSEYKALCFFALFWNAMTWAAIILGGDKILEAFTDNPIAYIFALFPFIGLFLIYQAIQQILAWKRFGQTPLVMDPFPGQLGGIVGGYVDVTIPYTAAHQLKTSLICTHYYWRKSGSERKKDSDVIWQDSFTVRPKPSAIGSRLYFEFEPPADLPESQLESRSENGDYYGWDVQINMPLEGADFERNFTVPVIKVSEQAIASSTRYARPVIERVGQNVATSISAIPQVSSVLGGTRFHYPLFRNKGMGIGLMIAGGFISVFLWFMQQGFSDFLPVTSMLFFGLAELIALALVVGGLYLIGNTLTAEVSLSGVRVRHRVLGFSFGSEIERTMIADIVAKKSASSRSGKSTRVWYSLNVIQKNGKISNVGDSIEDSRGVEEIRQQMINALGSGWSPSEPYEKPEALNLSRKSNHKISFLINIFRKIISFGLPAALIYDFREPLFKWINIIHLLLG